MPQRYDLMEAFVDTPAPYYDGPDGLVNGPEGEPVEQPERIRGRLRYEWRRGGDSWITATKLCFTDCGAILTRNWCPGTETWRVRSVDPSGGYGDEVTFSVTGVTPQDHSGETTLSERGEGWTGTAVNLSDSSGSLAIDSSETTATYTSGEIELGSAVGRYRLALCVSTTYSNTGRTWATTQLSDLPADLRVGEMLFNLDTGPAPGRIVERDDVDELYDPRISWRIETTVYESTGVPGDFIDHTPGEVYGRYFQFKVTMTRTGDTDDFELYDVAGTWSQYPEGAVSSVFGRTGDVVAVAGDYDATEITYDNTTSGLTADQVQDAIDEVVVDLDSKADASHTHAVTDLDDIATDSIVGRDTAGTGAPEVLTATQARGILNVEDGAQVNVVDSVHGRTGDVIAAVDDYAFSQIGSVPEARLLGRTTAGTGVTEALTATAARSFLNVEDGAESNDVDSVFGRTGAVVAASGDYDADEVTYDNTTSGLTATEVQSAIDEIVAASGVVTSVHGRTGDVVAVEGDYDINELGDVSGLAASQTLDLSTSGANEALMSDGSGSFAARALEAFDIASGAFVDARISESSVTQHEAAIDHNALANYSAENHRTINDGATSTTGLWSSTKISTELTGKADASHTHTAEEVEYDNATSGLTASDVQAALDEIDSNVDAITVPTISVPTSVIAVGSDPTGTVVDSDLGLTTETGRNGIAIGDVSALPDITTDLSVSVTGATNATPIVITTASPHGLYDGAIGTVSGVGGNTAANGVFSFTYVSDTELELDNSAGNGAYTSGGTLISGTATVTAFGTDNLTIGYGAGEDLTTWALLGSQILLGRDAGKGHSGGSVIAAGIEAGLSNEGWLCAFYGSNAGKYNIRHPGESIDGQVGVQGTAGPQYLIALGGNAGTFNAGAFCTAVGGYSGNTNVADNTNSYGWRAGRQNAGWGSNWMGLRSGENNAGAFNTGVGHRSFRTFTDDTPNAKTFDAADVTIGTDQFTDPGTITITSHGFGSVGQYVNLRITEGTGTLPSPMLEATTQTQTDEQIDIAQFLIVDANTLEAHGFLIASAGTGTGHTLTPKVVYENSSALGAYAEPDASNQVMLGDGDVTQVKSSGAFRSTSTDPSALDGALGIVDYLTIAPTLGANSVSINPATQTVGDGTLVVADLEGDTHQVITTASYDASFKFLDASHVLPSGMLIANDLADTNYITISKNQSASPAALAFPEVASGTSYIVTSRDLPASGNVGYVPVVREIGASSGIYQFRLEAQSAAAIDDLSDVSITSASTGDFLAYDGSDWVNSTDLISPTLTKSGNTNGITVEALDQTGSGNTLRVPDMGSGTTEEFLVTGALQLLDNGKIIQSGFIVGDSTIDTNILTFTNNQTSGAAVIAYTDLPTGVSYPVMSRDIPTSGEVGYVPVVRAVSGKYMFRLEAQSGGGASELNDLSDVDLTSIATNDLLQYDGSNVVNVASIAGTQVSYDPTGNSYVSGTTAQAAIDWIDLVFGVVQTTHIGVSQGVHGLGGGDAVVGTIKTQTLTNKTLTSPTINGAAINDADLADVIEMTLDDSGSATISSGVAAYNGIYMTIEAQTGMSDTLDRISGTPARCVLYLTASSGHSITLAHGTSTGDGYLLLLDDSDQIIDDESVIQFVKLPGGELRMIGSI